MDDLISKLSEIRSNYNCFDEAEEPYYRALSEAIEALSSCSEIPNSSGDVPDINVGDINKVIDELEEIFADIRERHVDDSVCGLCEYDGAYIGQSGDWCNECPGFDRDDCFKLSDKCRKQWIDTITNSLPSAQADIIYCKDCKFYSPMNRETKTGICNLTMHQNFGDNWFCAGAERRTDE